MSQCKIYLENYTGVYFAGTEIRGRLECYFDDETTVRAIKVRLKCKEHNEWTGTERYTDHNDNNRVKTRHVTYSGDREPMCTEQILFGSGSGSQTVPSGRHVYPFTYILPHHIPSSFHGPHGSILYKIKGIVDRPMRTDYEDKFIFIVKSPIDINKMFRDYLEPTNYSDEKTICCWCCTGGNITMDVELPKIAYMPGEIIDFKITITNLSNSSVERLRVTLTKKITFKVSSPSSESKIDSEPIAFLSEHGVGAHGEHTYNLQLEIPEHLEVPNFALCNLFEVSYKMEITSSLPGCTLDLEITIYPEFGHICGGEGNAWPNNAQTAITNGAPTEGFYPPPLPGFMPPAPGAGFSPAPVAPYPPGAGSGYPQANNSYPPPYPPTNGDKPPTYPGFSEKPIYPPGAPTAPMPTGPSAPPASMPEMPPPSYSQVQQGMAPYPPK